MKGVCVRLGVLGCLITGMSIFTGSAAEATGGSITGCTASPTSQTVYEEDPPAYVTLTFTGSPDPLSGWLQLYVDGVLLTESDGPVEDGLYSLAPWFFFPGQTVRWDFYATTGSGKTGGLLCSFSAFYSLGGGEDGTVESPVDDSYLDYMRERVESENNTDLPNTGGSAMVLNVVAGLGCLALGSSLVVVARRRRYC